MRRRKPSKQYSYQYKKPLSNAGILSAGKAKLKFADNDISSHLLEQMTRQEGCTPIDGLSIIGDGCYRRLRHG